MAQNGAGGHSSDEADLDDDDEALDDDMMDKISSSPSIDDGGCSLPIPQTPRRLSHPPLGFGRESVPLLELGVPPPASSASSEANEDGSSPLCDIPLHLPLAPASESSG